MFTSHGQVLFCQAQGIFTVAQQHSQVEHRFSGIKHIAATVGLKNQSYRRFLISESSTRSSSSGPSKFSTSPTDLCRDFVLTHAIFQNK
jgi:hypothetical protein